MFTCLFYLINKDRFIKLMGLLYRIKMFTSFNAIFNYCTIKMPSVGSSHKRELNVYLYMNEYINKNMYTYLNLTMLYNFFEIA